MGQTMRGLLLLLAILSPLVHAQYSPIVRVSWSAVTTQTDLTVIDPADLSYVVYDVDTSIPVCATQALTCDIDIAWGDCIRVNATAKQISTGLESAPSNEINTCSGVRPDFPLSAPVITVELVNGGQ